MQKDDLIGGEILRTVSNRFWGSNHRCDAIFIMPTTHVTMKEMIDGTRLLFNFDSVDVFSSSQLSTSLANGDKVVLGAVKLAIEQHQVKDVVLFRHQSCDDGKIFRAQYEREREDFAKISGLVNAREHLLRIYPEVSVRMIYARFLENGRYMMLSEVFPDRSEVFLMRPNNRFMSEDGQEIPCEAVVITCMDFRQFREVRTCVRDDFKLDLLRIIGLPGSSKELLKTVEDGNTSWGSFKKVVNNHAAGVYFIFHHGDCGAYGGLAEYHGDIIAEEKMHRNEMKKLRDKIIRRQADARVEMIYARFIEEGRRIRFVKFTD